MSRAALLFDLDGTLVDTDHLHQAAFDDMLAAEGLPRLGVARYKAEIMGQPNAEIARRLFPDDPERGAALIAAKEAGFRARLAASVPPLGGIHDLLDWAGAEGAGVAVVTNAPRANAEAMLAAAGLAHRLTELVIGEECARPKPDPLPYQEAMRRLGATPARSLAFEDSRSGLRAARAAGARVFGLSTGLSAAELLQAGAHQVISDYADPALWVALQSLKARVA
jgi:HAD superfamily hydrolase (TIGR01509 family)